MFESTKKAGEIDFESFEQLNEYMNAMKDEPFTPETDEEKAQILAYDAYETDDLEKRASLAEEALALDPNSIDARLVKSTFVSSPLKKENLLLKAINIGLRSLDLKSDELWMNINARPFLRAQEALAEHFVEIGEKEKAITLYEELLQYNVNDNQGVRFVLFRLYIEENKLNEADELLAEFPGKTADWKFSEVLLLLKRNVSEEFFSDKLFDAHLTNSYFISVLVGEIELPDRLPERYTPGSLEEAIIYGYRNKHLWQDYLEILNIFM